jgi:Fe-S cluster assembly iron-binding protein IscA
MITLTERAAKKIQSLASKKGLAPVLRVKVGAGGCSGMSYEFLVADDVAPTDLVHESR